MKTITTLISFIFIVNFSVAQPGTLDSSFGVNGVATIVGFGIIKSTALQPDGKIVVVGREISESVVIIARYNANGSPDSAFGDNGIVYTDLGDSKFNAANFEDLVIQPDGKIVVTGSGFFDKIQGYYYDALTIRYNTDGSIDKSFGNKGIVVSDFEDDHDEGKKIALQPDGKIVVGGISGASYVIARYNTDGSLDNSFNGGKGWVKGGLGGVTLFTSMALQADAKIVIGCNIASSGSLIRYKTNGTKDSSFGVNGTVKTDPTLHYEIINITVQQDKKIIAVGHSLQYATGRYVAIILRYEYNGKADTSFGEAGIVKMINDTASVFAKDIVLQKDGKIIITGGYSDLSGFVSTATLMRLNNDGSLNDHFGEDGIVKTEFRSFPANPLIQPDGKMIALGGVYYAYFLARYNNNEPVTISFTKNIKITEGNSDINIAHFEIVLNKISKKDVQVIAETKDVTAVAGEDYKPILRKVTIKAGSTSASIDVKIKGDTLTEGNEKFLMVLSNPVNAIIGKVDTAVCTIEDDDALFAINASSFDNEVNNIIASIKIYPNPVNNHLLLSGLSAAAKTTLSIIDMNGNSRLVATVRGSSYNWNIGQLKAGSYILRIENGDLVVSNMFIKE